ncbi:hypothetical protein BJX62DRAFT_242943 [Aspergillus germanicus]
MEYSVSLDLPAYADGKANHVEADAEATNKQRRKIQNQKNQRARQDKGARPRLRPDLAPFQVWRWRLDEPDDDASRIASSALNTSIGPRPTPPHTHANNAHTSKPRSPRGSVHRSSPCPEPPQPTGHHLPLSTDHLLHLIPYNVFRAFVSNKRSLNTMLTGWTDKPPPPFPTTCPISGPYRDDTAVYPLNPHIPLCLVPTRLQQTGVHSLWINLLPFPGVRDNLISREGSFDVWEFLQDLIGELMGANMPTRERRGTGTPQTITVSDPTRALLPAAGRDDDDDNGVTAARRGLIVWGEPHDMRSWEATPGFLAKWSWAVEGCHDLVESSNRWRVLRGEEPMCISGGR